MSSDANADRWSSSSSRGSGERTRSERLGLGRLRVSSWDMNKTTMDCMLAAGHLMIK